MRVARRFCLQVCLARSYRTSARVLSLSRTLLEGTHREMLVQDLDGWKDHAKEDESDRDCISKTFLFKDFKDAFKFMRISGNKAEELDHHPEWFNVYNKVDVTLSTHTENGVTAYDITLAKHMDSVADRINAEIEADNYLLHYEYVADILEKRGPFRENHLQNARDGIVDGKILQIGTTQGATDIPTGAVITFEASKEEVQNFVKNDPYVQQGLVYKHDIKKWNVPLKSIGC
eukprot:TRINITY_DN18486_c0_g1_i1.p1 TRINITY_DN18486_c0_g1~~TRINITY_DN18486_c0_g1_i1.p1  ORF type:complete len:257 (+),score=40.62 TRINITY_DN18486_c0_g1_i1:76-771(+)